MTITGKDADDAIEAAFARDAQERAEALARATADAESRGKEPFDLTKLETMADTSREGRLAPDDVRRARYEYKYYVGFPNVFTLEEFAREIAEINRW